MRYKTDCERCEEEVDALYFKVIFCHLLGMTEKIVKSSVMI
jgi:hypothetical protein